MRARSAWSRAMDVGGSVDEQKRAPHAAVAPSYTFHHDFTRLRVSKPGDAREQEAERIASNVTSFELPRDVRIHTGARAEAAARALDARAFTVGNDVYFGAGQYAPHRAEGRQLLAHELVHVRQRAPGIHRAPMSVPDNTESELESLLLEIISRTKWNKQAREELDALPPASSSERDGLTSKLAAGRLALMAALQKRIALLTTEIGNLGSAVAASGMQSSAAHPESEGQFTKLTKYQEELKQHETQLQQFTRWQTRERIKSIDQEIADLDAEIAKLPPVSDPNAPEADLKLTRRNELVDERKKLGKSLTSTAKEFKQFDKRWGGTRYGDKKECSAIKEGGCGPSTLAILLNYLYAEDPETLVNGPIEFVTPLETAKYAETHGRVCGHGTNGETMVTKVSTQWPGFRGRSIKLDQAAEQIRGGNLVIFLCHNCRGQQRGGKGTRFYAGHFMVLNGADETGETFNVLDPGDTESADIETITKAELKKTGQGYWIIEKK